MLGVLSEGYEIEPDVTNADIVIVNTCCFINDAKQESVEAILEAAQLKEGRCKKLVVAG
jgi:ribosomal protein S12 methylthiotransferase